MGYAGLHSNLATVSLGGGNYHGFSPIAGWSMEDHPIDTTKWDFCTEDDHFFWFQ
jgi:hypothetical protein